MIVLDHGSPRPEANRLFESTIAGLARQFSAPLLAAHMEGDRPGLSDAFASLADKGVTQIVVVPLFFGSGQHLSNDIPRLCAEACKPQQHFCIMPPLLQDPNFVDYLAERVRTKLKEA